MNFDKFTTKAQEILSNTQKLVIEKQNQYMDVEHLLFIMLNEDNGMPYLLLENLKVNIPKLQTMLKMNIDARPKVQGNINVYISPVLDRVMNMSFKEAEHLKDDFISTEHFLIAIIGESKTSFFDYLIKNNIKKERI